MSLYSEIAAEAHTLLTEFGAVGILRRKGFDTYDPNTATTSDTDSPIDVAATAVVLPYAAEAIDGTIIQREDKKVYMSVVGVATPPRVSDVFIWEDGTYTIVHPLILAPNGENVLYELQVRR